MCIHQISLATKYLSQTGFFHIMPQPQRYVFQHLRCCVPGCLTYDMACNFLHIPARAPWRRQLLGSIPDAVNHNRVVCLKHFNFNSELRPVKNRVPPFKGGAGGKHRHEPCKKYWPKLMFEIAKRDSIPETFGDLENADYIINFNYLWRLYHKNLKDLLQSWKAVASSKYIMFFHLDCCPVPRVTASIKITPDLKVFVTLDGREMDLADLTWIIPITGGISRWSQLRMLLEQFGRNFSGIARASGLSGVVIL